MKSSIKINIFKIVLSYLIAILLYQIVFKKSDILVYLTTNSSASFWSAPWIFLYLFAGLIFLLFFYIGKELGWKQLLIFIFLIIVGINLDRFIDIDIFKFPIIHTTVNHILSYTPAWKILIFAFSFSFLLDPQKIKARINLKTINIILNILLALTVLMYFLIPILNHLNYRESGLDMGLYDQAIWKYSLFKFPANTIDGFWGLKNILADHFEIILPIISWIYWIKKSVIMLHLLNGIVVATGGYFAYLLGKLKLNNNILLSKMISLVFLGYTGLQMAFMEGQFHPLCYVATLIIIIIYLIEKRKWLAYFIALIILLSIKESMGLYAFFIGVYIFTFHRKYWKIALATSAIGVIHYLVTVKTVSTLYGSYRYFNYTTLGSTSVGVVKSIITNPLYALYVFLNPIGKIETLSLTLASFGLSVISPPLVIGIPMFAERFLCDDAHIWQFYMHYNTPLAGLLTCALIFYLAQNYFSGKSTFISKNINVYSFLFFVLLSSFLVNINYRSSIVKFWYNAKENIIVDKNSKDINQAIKLIPKDASVATQNAIVTHLSERDRIYELPVVRDADYIVVSSAKDYWPLTDQEFRDILKSRMTNERFGIRYLKDKVLILQKDYHGEINEIPVAFFEKN